MIRARMTPPSANGNGSAPAIYKHVPSELRDDISHILETEGMMNESAENRILKRIDDNHKETLSELRELQDTLHDHDKRLVLVEKDVAGLKEVANDIDTLKSVAADVGALKTAAKDAADERRNTSRLVKAAIVGSVMSIIIGALVSVYGTRAPVVQEVKEAKQDVKQDTAELTTQIKELIEALKAKTPAPVNTSTPKARSRQRPEPVPGPGARLRDDTLHANSDPPLPIIGLNAVPLPVMKVPE